MKQAKAFSLGSALATLLSAFFIGIMFYILFEVIHIQEYSVYGMAVFFAAVNFSLLFLLCLFSAYLPHVLNTASFISLCFTTGLFTVIQNLNLIFFSGLYTKTAYVLFNLILLFVYSCIVLPTVAMGIKNNKTRRENT